MSKPDERIYKIILDQLNIKPEEAVFLDDLGFNLKAAKEIGLQTIRVNILIIKTLENVLIDSACLSVCHGDSLSVRPRVWPYRFTVAVCHGIVLYAC